MPKRTSAFLVGIGLVLALNPSVLFARPYDLGMQPAWRHVTPADTRFESLASFEILMPIEAIPEFVLLTKEFAVEEGFVYEQAQLCPDNLVFTAQLSRILTRIVIVVDADRCFGRSLESKFIELRVSFYILDKDVAGTEAIDAQIERLYRLYAGVEDLEIIRVK